MAETTLLQPFLGNEQLDKHADGNENYGDLLQQRCRHIHKPTDHVARGHSDSTPEVVPSK